jgi:hypothetical protein
MGIEEGQGLRPIHDDAVMLEKIVVPATCITEAIS